MSFTPAELAYAAGLIDGEGTITIVRRCGSANREGKRKNRYHELVVELANTDRRMIEWLHQRWPATLSYWSGGKNTKAKGRWTWILTSGRALAFIEDVRPYLVLKGQQADIGIVFRSTYVGRGRTVLPDGVRENREAMKLSIMALNKRGV
jgi:hypothetical protein